MPRDYTGHRRIADIVLSRLRSHGDARTVLDLAAGIDCTPEAVLMALRGLMGLGLVERAGRTVGASGRKVTLYRAVDAPGMETARRETPSGWAVVDLQTDTLYVDVIRDSEVAAVDLLWELLRGYDADSEWTRRLVVRRVGDAPVATEAA